ncbi:MAG: hypothetical protein M5U22_18240 [Thermoleophilia bacterium]|nr:hypothetical protein [Thermoleophilia bacterium]
MAPRVKPGREAHVAVDLPAAAGESDLASLLSVEERLAELLAAADEEAARLEEVAQARIREADIRLEAELEETRRALRRQIEADTEESLARIAAESAAEAARYERVRGAELERLAADLAVLVALAASPAEAGPEQPGGTP